MTPMEPIKNNQDDGQPRIGADSHGLVGSFCF
jgi:hypothetical protein